ncbi:long-chain-fatty-acid--CoA ligase [candidate division LCP-89 bacterium B3_LCP]|uniref:Long-chain-fatty-acid--CoA ligase n=1 Tax=candidate division LCP-89 bacterium B3_LCP TaxID=2012998 RepID=A0A532V3W4_UNCL8|nr:MAG: long-chain-fatty-acid--CoA ligase [candidate division LCP-89 bacterium B3_LCP]
MEITDNNLANLLKKYVIADPARILCITGDEETKAKTVWDSSCRFSSALKEIGIQRGSRIILVLPNSVEYIIAYYAILAAGAVVVPANVMLKARELHYLMDDCEARAIISGIEKIEDVLSASESLTTLRHQIIQGDKVPHNVLHFERLIEEHQPDEMVADVSSNDTAVILYTAGTTGRPKGAELTHSALLGNAQMCINLFQARPDDRILGILPFFHAFGQTAVMNTGIGAGASLVLLPEFEPEDALTAIKKHQVTIFMGNPSMFSMMLTYPNSDQYDFSSVRYCVSGGSALKPDLMKSFEEKFNTEILESYGLCETTALATFNHMHRDRHAGSVGMPVDGVEVRVVDDSGEDVRCGEVGELIIRSDYLMKGYLNRPEATREVVKDGWFHSGDMGFADDDGYLHIIDRKTDMIVKSGFNVYPAEIEELLRAHPSIKEAAIIGIPDYVQGEEIKACIVINEGETLSAEDLASYCKERLAKYKCPRYIQFYQQLPESPSGKILKNKLKNSS